MAVILGKKGLGVARGVQGQGDSAERGRTRNSPEERLALLRTLAVGTGKDAWLEGLEEGILRWTER